MDHLLNILFTAFIASASLAMLAIVALVVDLMFGVI